LTTGVANSNCRNLAISSSLSNRSGLERLRHDRPAADDGVNVVECDRSLAVKRPTAARMESKVSRPRGRAARKSCHCFISCSWLAFQQPPQIKG
jgi:hypothetical protein